MTRRKHDEPLVVKVEVVVKVPSAWAWNWTRRSVVKDIRAQLKWQYDSLGSWKVKKVTPVDEGRIGDALALHAKLRALRAAVGRVHHNHVACVEALEEHHAHARAGRAAEALQPGRDAKFHHENTIGCLSEILHLLSGVE